LGALDTLRYHEWQQRLATRATARRELLLHASRDFAYELLFGSLAWTTWNGWWSLVLAALLLCEIVITLLDFVEEDLRRPLPPGERVMHTILAIVYGAFLANLLPQMAGWAQYPSGFAAANYGLLSWLLTAMAVGVAVSGIRDLLAGLQLQSRNTSLLRGDLSGESELPFCPPGPTTSRTSPRPTSPGAVPKVSEEVVSRESPALRDTAQDLGTPDDAMARSAVASSDQSRSGPRAANYRAGYRGP
jgi:hypothetical protein